MPYGPRLRICQSVLSYSTKRSENTPQVSHDADRITCELQSVAAVSFEGEYPCLTRWGLSDLHAVIMGGYIRQGTCLLLVGLRVLLLLGRSAKIRPGWSILLLLLRLQVLLLLVLQARPGCVIGKRRRCIVGGRRHAMLWGRPADQRKGVLNAELRFARF